MQCNTAILHQFAVFPLILTLGDFLRQTIVHEALQLATNTACFAFIAEANIYIMR